MIMIPVMLRYLLVLPGLKALSKLQTELQQSFGPGQWVWPLFVAQKRNALQKRHGAQSDDPWASIK